jgi:hypothetical protein
MAKKKTKAQKQKARELRRRKRKALQQQSFKAKKSSGQSLTNSFFKQFSFGWNKKTKVKAGISKTKEISFFDYVQWVKAGQQKSYAVAESFMNMVSELKYEDLDRFTKMNEKMIFDDKDSMTAYAHALRKQVRNKKYSVESIQFIFDSLIGDEQKYGALEGEFIGYFMQLKDRIKCKKLKFCLLTRIYQVDSKYVDFEELKELRSNFTFEEMVWITCANRGHDKSEQFKRYIQRWIDDINKLNDKQGFLRVYRSFRVKRGEKIRQGLTRECKTMEGGKGNSFTFRKSVAIKLNSFVNTYMITKYLELTEQKKSNKLAKEVLQGEYMNHLSEHKNDDRFKDTFGVIGEFKIKKDDIIVFSDTLAEAEVVMDYKKAKLEDYTFTNIIHYFASIIEQTIIKRTDVKEHKGKSHLQVKTFNVEHLFDTCYWFTSKYFNKHKDELRECVRNGGMNKKAYDGIIKEIALGGFDADTINVIYESHVDDNLFQFVAFKESGVNNTELLAIEHKEDAEMNIADITGVRQTKKKALVYSDMETY